MLLGRYFDCTTAAFSTGGMTLQLSMAEDKLTDLLGAPDS